MIGVERIKDCRVGQISLVFQSCFDLVEVVEGQGF